MEPPIGFVRLRDNADEVGRKVYGHAWRPLSENSSEVIAAWPGSPQEAVDAKAEVLGHNQVWPIRLPISPVRQRLLRRRSTWCGICC
jgi:hypothetical protein